ncbi:YfjI family protein [Marinobacter salicampi]|uniref:YfjI family protein n=1 Tax=Marinobacter salicampi TaxID=435907 RepID=UPI00140DD034|nr:YfjI family protein [Marinobacter salicampi]
MNVGLINAKPPEIDDWPDLIPLSAPSLPGLDPKLLPDWAGEYARAVAAETETSPELAVGMILAACSTAAARSVRVELNEGHTEPCNIWIVAALPPGNRKSAVQAAATAPLVNWEQSQASALNDEIKRLSSERMTIEARAKELRGKAAKEKGENRARELAQEVADIEANIPEVPKPPQIWTADVTPERLGSLLAEQDECMAWLSSEGGIFELLNGRYSNGIPNLDLVLKSHSGDADRVDRGSRPAVFLKNPLLTIGLSPQPDVLRGLSSKPGFRGRGLLGRFLYLLPPSLLGYRKLTPNPVPKHLTENYEAGIHAMLNWKPATGREEVTVPHDLHLSSAARTEHHAFAIYIEGQMRPGGKLENFTDWAGKAPGAALRLAGVLHAIRHAHGAPWMADIPKETMDSALSIMATITQHSLAALDLMGADPNTGEARFVWDWICRARRNRFTLRDAFEALKGTFNRVKNLRPAIEVLEERGYIKVIEIPSEGPGRRPSPLICVRPDIVETWR